jgi:ADP-heptose:LPS heptosyltransferase
MADAIRKILVFRAGGLGDLLVAGPAMLALRRTFPGAEMTIAARAAYAELLVETLRPARIVEIGSSLFSPLFLADAELPQDETPARFVRGFDLVVSWMGGAEEPFARNVRRAGVASVVAAEDKPTSGSRIHVSDYLVGTLAELGVVGGGEPWRLGLSHQSRGDCEKEMLSRGVEAGCEVFAVQPGSGGLSKCWPTERFVSVAREFGRREGMSVAWLLGPAELERAERFQTDLPAEFVVIAGPGLPTLAALLARSTVYLGNDSGVTHLAAAVGAPTLALFGATNPRVWAPRGECVEVIRRRELTKLSEKTVLERLARLARRRRGNGV